MNQFPTTAPWAQRLAGCAVHVSGGTTGISIDLGSSAKHTAPIQVLPRPARLDGCDAGPELAECFSQFNP